MRNWKQRLCSLLLCGAMLASLCPTALAEDGGIPYLDKNGEVQSCETYTTVTPELIGWNTDKNPSGWYVVENSVEIKYSVTVTGEVHLILANDCDLKVNGGINVGIGSSLTIYAQSKDESAGKLTAIGSSNAGIGGGGNITINGGTVTASGYQAAGIGGGYMDSGGNITINGGTVTATGVDGAGIGGGWMGGGGNITINGGTVTATSDNGAGIGGGNDGGSGGTIAINGGTVTATSNGSGAGIGGGKGGAGGQITISGGEVTATGKSGAGIGGGGGSGDNSGDPVGGAGGNITISGGTVKASSGSGADIGGGFDDKTGGIAPSDKIEIGEGADVKGSGGGKPNLGPPHGAKTEWASDGTVHWHPCEVGSCAEQFDKAAHSYGKEWESDADRHWHECSCGDKSDEAAHSFDEWITDQEPTYRPDVTQPSQGGSVSISPSSPQRGDTVTVTPRPDEGYELDSITVTDRDGKSVELTAGPDGTYTFRQPSGRVKIEVAFKPIETPWNNPFSDVSQDDWYYEAVRFAQEQGLMNGYSDGRFGAEDTLSRSQLAQILFNKEGRPGVNYLPEFSDMAGGAWYTEAVRWAASQGIVGGYGDGTFGPNAPITREQLAVMLWRYSGSPAAASSKELDFNDAGQISGYALEALRWAVESGVLNGDGGGRLDPQGQATRAQVAQILKNFLEEENT